MPYKCFTSAENVQTEFTKISSISGYHFYQKNSNNVERLEIVSAWSKFLPNGFGDFFPNLIEMEVRETPLRSLRRSNFVRMSKLIILNIDDTRLSEIQDDTFIDLIRLQELTISKSFLKTFPVNILTPLPKLRLFDAKHNLLSYLDGFFFSENLKLESVNLSGNLFKNIEVDFTKLENINEIYLFDSGCVNSFYIKNNSKFTLNGLQKLIKKRCQTQDKLPILLSNYTI